MWQHWTVDAIKLLIFPRECIMNISRIMQFVEESNYGIPGDILSRMGSLCGSRHVFKVWEFRKVSFTRKSLHSLLRQIAHMPSINSSNRNRFSVVMVSYCLDKMEKKKKKNELPKMNYAWRTDNWIRSHAMPSFERFSFPSGSIE